MATAPSTSDERHSNSPPAAAPCGPASKAPAAGAAPSPPRPSAAAGAPWSLSIKPVGGEHASSAPPSSPGSSPRQPLRDFVVQVSPNDALSDLHDRIEAATGLQPHQQRLIYRGQLLAGRNRGGRGSTDGSRASEAAVEREEVEELKLRDIRGLCDGQTIHLVRKREVAAAAAPPEDGEGGAPTPLGRGGGEAPAPGDGESTPTTEVLGSTSGAAPLLAALLGLGSTTTETGDGTTEPRRGASTGTSSAEGRQQPRGGGRSATRPSLMGASRRRPNHRLTAEDLEAVIDPGSLEPVRQGLLTLHTLLPHAQNVSASAASTSACLPPSPQRDTPPRRWYVGQWIDCLDTVNQWLEATIVEIALPNDVLPPRGCIRTPPRATPRLNSVAAPDPVVTAHDLEGRKMLLLEPLDDPDEQEGDADDSDDDGSSDYEYRGYRRRDPDDSPIQLLLVHYNGWPHRWDEWIRSDSPRIRPFRARTRHPNSSSHASPTPQSLLPEPPSTRILRPPSSEEPEEDGRHNDHVESLDRAALLPELLRVSDAVHQLARTAASHIRTCEAPALPASNEAAASTLEERPHLPWARHTSPAGAEVSADASVSAAGLRAELEALAPLLDRLGRTLVDAAPQVAALARSIENGPQAAAPPEAAAGDGHPTSLGGLLSLLGRDRRRHQSASSSNIEVPGAAPDDEESALATSPPSAASEVEAVVVDPDWTDFASGAVNTTRGEVRRGPRSNRSSTSGGSSGGDDAAGLLGAYLAAASLNSLVGGSSGSGGDSGEDGNALQGLGRLLRERGAGGGIDIHIHAVVTAPGLPTGGLGLTAIGAGGAGGGLFGGVAGTGTNDGATESPTPLFAPRGSLLRSSPARNTQPRSTPSGDEDEDGIFSELYSDNPEPIDPSRPFGTASNHTSNATPTRRPSRTDLALALVSRSPARNVSSSSSSSASARSNNAAPGGERSSSGRRSNGGGGLLGRLFRRNPSTDL